MHNDPTITELRREKMKKKVILASQSPRRRELLGLITNDFDVMPSHVDESVPKGMKPDEAVNMLSHKKASYIANNNKNALVIGSDTVIVFNGEIVGKPDSDEQAQKILRALSGNTHQVMTGVTVIDSENDSFIQQIVTTTVKFREIPEGMLETYIKSGEHKDKAGSYAIQGKGALFVDSIDGCFYNVVGFPINTIAKMLESLGAITYEN